MEGQAQETSCGWNMKQSELIKQLSDKELKLNLLFTQLLFLGISILLSLFLFDHFSDWLLLFDWQLKEIFYFGIIPAFIIVLIDILLINLLPDTAFDDGGVNRRIFGDQPASFIFGISLLVAVSEELLFRGVIQSTFGYLFASILFAIVHIRYLKKPVLLLSVLLVSFFIGYIFSVTENLIVTITLHFIVDFLLGLYIRFRSEVHSY